MKTITKVLFFAYTILSSLCAHAYDFEVDGIYYNVSSLTDLTCSVTSGTSKYSGYVKIPSKVNYNDLELSVISIEKSAFYDCKELTSIVIPNSVTSIGAYAFDYCSALTSIEIPNSVMSIEKNAFDFCSSLDSIIIPNSVTSIEAFAFSHCTSLRSITLSDKLSTFPMGMFTDCSSLVSLTIPDGIEHIEQGFVSSPSNTVWYCPFDGCTTLRNLTIEYSSSILYAGYLYCYTTHVAQYEFRERKWMSWINKLYYLTIDRELNYSMTPTSLKELTLGEHIRKVQVEVKNCNNLSKITCLATTPPTELTATNKQYKDVEVKVPKGCLEAYQNAEGWKNFWNMSEMEDGESGVDSVIADEAKTEIGRYNLQGHKVGDDYRGMVIIKYSDGSTRKILNN